MTPEGKVKAAVKKILQGHGVKFVNMPVPGGFGKNGAFDFSVVYYGVAIGIETKASPKEKPTPLQIKNAREHCAAGGISMLIHSDNLIDLDELLIHIHRVYGRQDFSKLGNWEGLWQ